MPLLKLIERTISRFIGAKAVGQVERSVAIQDNERPFAKDIEREQRARDEYLDSIGYPKELR